ncbi:hypothetical protein BDR04DRAFT_861537 [Suillus decipiens]|nr:hypothetical protein BDR04DRAFT_861537 [Suillus decipiens]
MKARFLKSSSSSSAASSVLSRCSARNMCSLNIHVYHSLSALANNVLDAVNGLAQTSASMGHAVGPALTTSPFTFSNEHNVLNGNAVYFVLILLAGVSRWLVSQLPDEIQDRDK